ncbi:Piwi domain-containing protein [Aridibaculum aurantiacum]|uniref:Piwi domain-containing protein n=1 Tax=Aridibaculum aurantiacum TaxID=2810307 RepID=UPI001A973FD5|nr:Piwi domain-containing protein [Aridibaculum aurantiacum]
MNKPILMFNILTFDFPKRKPTFYFSTNEEGSFCKLHKSLFPKRIDNLFPDASTTVQEIYTTFDYPRTGFLGLEMDFKNENPDLIKKYYNRIINYHFKKTKKQLVKTGFINETQVWVKSTKQSTEQFTVYEKFSIKVQLCHVSNHPELLVSYDGRSRVSKQNIQVLTHDVSQSDFNWTVQDNKLLRFEDLEKLPEPHFETAYPLINNRLRRHLNLPVPENKRDNPYDKYLDKIQQFAKHFLLKKEFRDVIPLNTDSFIKVSQGRINETELESNELTFGGNNTGKVPKYGIRDFKPFKKSPWSKVHLFFVMHKDDVETAKTLDTYFKSGFGWFKGLYDYARILFHTEKNFSVIFNDKDNPLPEIEDILSTKRTFNPDVKYIAIYITPHSKNVDDESKHILYYRVKELLLKRDITSQVIDPAKLIEQGKNYTYSLTNIAVAMLAKLDGIPWRLDTPIKNELIVGIGAFRHKKDQVQYLGSAFSFDNTGGFNNFDYFMKHQTDQLAGKIEETVKDFAAINNAPDRLIIHFYKELSRKELEPIEKALDNLELDRKIPIYIITVNKTEAEDIVAFDTEWEGLMPVSGTYINIGQDKYLLFNNTRYPDGTFSSADGYPFPVKLTINCNEKNRLRDAKVMRELINQVYQFSRMYWKSIRQQNLPVTTKYPEMVAQIAPYFQDGVIPEYGKNNLWFL